MMGWITSWKRVLPSLIVILGASAAPSAWAQEQDAGFINDCFGIREAEVSFHQAMMTQVDELHTSRHLEMTYLEFLEGVARAASKANLVLDHNKPQHRNHSLELSLVVRVEAAMPALLKVCPRTLRENFKFPTSEEFTKLMFTVRK